MARRKLPLSFVFLLLATCRDSVAPAGGTTKPNPQPVSVLTQHNDNSRSGWNDNETALTTTNVNVQQFGEALTLPVDDQGYARPLAAAPVNVGGNGENDVLIATVKNAHYAYDGDNVTLYWQKNFTAPGMRPPQN